MEGLNTKQKLEEEFYTGLGREINPYFNKNDDLHGLSHSKRVWNVSKQIMNESANMDVVILQSFLHDIANPMEMRGEIECHAQKGSEIARDLLIKKNLTDDLIDDVCYSISVHRVSKGLIPETYEAKILQDADRLDALGAIIIARCFDHASQKGVPYYIEGIQPRDFYDGSPSVSTIHHIQEKILRLTPDKFHTPKAQKIAKGRYEYVKGFVDRFIKEWRGEL